jgi:hypothetical protein
LELFNITFEVAELGNVEAVPQVENELQFPFAAVSHLLEVTV